MAKCATVVSRIGWWVAHTDWKLCSTDANFLAAVKVLYGQIAEQMRGEFWKDGGPVIGIQVDNEFGGSSNYLMELKKLALQKDAAGKTMFEKVRQFSVMKVGVEPIQPAGTVREIPMSSGRSHIAIAPTDVDFTNAAVWKISCPRRLT